MSLEIFDRYFNIGARISYGSSAGTRLTVANPTGNGTRIVWNVKKTNTSSDNVGSVTVYNLSESNIGIIENIQSLIAAFKFQAQLDFGWDGQLSKLMTGQITKIQSQVREATDVLTVIEFGENVISNRSAQPQAIQVADALWIAAFEAIAKELDVKLSNQFRKAVKDNPVALTTQTVNAIFDDDSVKDMDTLVSGMGAGYDWTIEDGEIFLLNNGAFQDTSSPQILRPNTGLLGYTNNTDGGLDITALGHPGVRPGQQILVYDGDNKQLGGGAMRVEEVSWSGDTNQGCQMAIIARRLSELGF